MGLNLAALTFETRPAVVDFGDAGTLNIEWAPGKLTPAAQSELVGGYARSDSMVIANLLATLITSWDVMLEDGSTAPITSEFIGGLPLDVIGKVYAAINGASTVGEANGAT